MWRVLILPVAVAFTACNVPVAPVPSPTGEEIAFGGGAGGPADACFSCHGLKGEGREDAPRLAGQSAGYLLKQVEDYASGWRKHKQMAAIAGRLDDGDRTQVSLYYAALPAPDDRSHPAHQPVLFASGDAARGVRACSECHGASGEGVGYANPRLAGQREEYVVRQLTAWKTSKRRNDPQDVMGAIARNLTAEEIEALAAYVASLP